MQISGTAGLDSWKIRVRDTGTGTAAQKLLTARATSHGRATQADRPALPPPGRVGQASDTLQAPVHTNRPTSFL